MPTCRRVARSRIRPRSGRAPSVVGRNRPGAGASASGAPAQRAGAHRSGPEPSFRRRAVVHLRSPPGGGRIRGAVLAAATGTGWTQPALQPRYRDRTGGHGVLESDVARDVAHGQRVDMPNADGCAACSRAVTSPTGGRMFFATGRPRSPVTLPVSSLRLSIHATFGSHGGIGRDDGRPIEAPECGTRCRTSRSLAFGVSR